MSVFCRNCRGYWKNHCRECSFDFIEFHKRDKGCELVDYVPDEVRSYVNQYTGDLATWPDWLSSHD